MSTRIGETGINNRGTKMTIVEYNNSKDIIVEFETGNKVNTTYKNFQIGNVKNPCDKTVYGVGYIGVGEYKVSINLKKTIQYKYWSHMLERCYDENSHKRNPTYINCSVHQDWHNFQTFAKWFDENYYECDGERMQLDKDILQKGNKVYSSHNCVFVPQRINVLFTKNNIIRGEYPIGVSVDRINNNFRARCSTIIEGKKKENFLGHFDNPQEAFYKGYKPFKESYIKEVVELYVGKIPESLYNAMMNYVVEIDD